MKLKMTKSELQAFLRDQFHAEADQFIVDDVQAMQATLRLPMLARYLRPGQTPSGPTMFAVADVAMYVAVLAMIGPVALAVTTNCSIDFMRKPDGVSDLVGHARLLKLGRSLAVGDVMIYSAGNAAPVARAGMTYSIPPRA